MGAGVRINFVTRSGPHLASHRLRTEVAAGAFPGSVVGPYVPADVHVFSKHWDPAEVELAKGSLCSVFDICDNHFGNEKGEHYRRMCDVVDVVVASSERLAEDIWKETGRDAVIIEEPYDGPEGEPKFSPEMRLFWFGHRANLRHLEAIAASLADPVAICTNPQWTPQKQAEGLEWCDLVLLPQSERWKSANRAVTALRAGRYAVADPVDSYEGLCWTGGVLEGIEWVKQNPGSIIERIRQSQKIIAERFSPQRIQKQWFDCISGAAGNTFPVSST
jgi:hypothetical protein